LQIIIVNTIAVTYQTIYPIANNYCQQLDH